MSIDYKAYKGIGYKVSENEELIEAEEMGEELDDGLLSYIDEECENGFDCFETGNAWNGEMTGVYLTLKNPFENGLDLTAMKEKLDQEAERLKLHIESEFGVVGGLYVY